MPSPAARRSAEGFPTNTLNASLRVGLFWTGLFLAAKDAEGAKSSVVLAAEKPSVLKVEPGNWFCIKQDGSAEVMVFSDCKVGEFENDDFRRPL